MENNLQTDVRRLLIGKNPDNDVVVNAPGISRYHAALTVSPESPGAFLLEDTGSREKISSGAGEPDYPGSTNGTWVNGLRVRQKIVTPADRVTLAGIPLDLGQVVGQALRAAFPTRKKTDANDFTEEFFQLKQVYESYKKTRLKLQRDANLANATKIIPGFGFGLYALASLAMKTNEKMFVLNEEFRIRYVCPNCKMPLGDFPWETLANQKSCLRCKAIWSR
ncbi:FHA domain-containing protein [Larkinella soli]|uniref:FHA domain-containing protein n=1 Tax=Larkinella soli TaxID=1770527 RepID=UPI000FFB466A|nr:FHA domain-containing protein [Larkinella soli]